MDDCILKLVQILVQVDHIDENDFRSRSVEWDSCDDNIDSGKCVTLDLGIGIFSDDLHFDQITHGLAAAIDDGHLWFMDGLFCLVQNKSTAFLDNRQQRNKP